MTMRVNEGWNKKRICESSQSRISLFSLSGLFHFGCVDFYCQGDFILWRFKTNDVII